MTTLFLTIPYIKMLNRKKLIITIAVVGLAHLFVGALVVLLPFIARELSEDNIQILGNFEMMLGIGMLMGAISIQLIGKKDLKDKNLFAYIAALGIFYVSLAITKLMTGTLLVCYMIILLLIGATIAYAAVYWQSILQMHTSTDMAGRVFSISSMVGNISLPISYGLFGILLKYISIVKLMIFSGAALIIISMILMYFYSDNMRREYSKT